MDSRSFLSVRNGLGAHARRRCLPAALCLSLTAVATQSSASSFDDKKHEAPNYFGAVEWMAKTKKPRSKTDWGNLSGYSGPATDLDRFVEGAKEFPAVEAVAKHCATLKEFYGNDREDCERSKTPKATLLAALKKRLAMHEAHWAAAAHNIVDEAKTSGRSSADDRERARKVPGEVEEALSAYRPAFAALGEKMPADAFAETLKTWATLSASLKNAENKSLFTEAKEKHAAIGAVAKRIAKSVPEEGFSFVNYAVWRGTETKKNEFGIPLFKYRTVRVAIKKTDESFCRAYDVIVQSDYVGGGRYGEWYFLAGDGLEYDFETKSFDRGRCK